MIIAVNTRLLLHGKLEGIGRFTAETLRIITQAHPEHRFIFIFDRKFSDEFIFSSNITPLVCHPQARHPLLWYWYFEHSLPPLLKKYKAELFLSPDGWLSLKTPVKSLPVIHDLNFFHFPQFLPLPVKMYYNIFFPEFIKKAHRIATVSEFSKQDIVEKFSYDSNKIDVVYNGAADFKPMNDNEKQIIRNRYSKEMPYFLSVGLIHPRKNITNLINAYSLFRNACSENIKLLIVGAKKWWTSDMEEAYKKCPYKNDIIFTGRIGDTELKKVIASALALTYISFFEGFGIPVLEAMYTDTPVICSSGSSLPEVGGESVIYVDPNSPESIKSAMILIAKDEKVRKRLVEKGKIQREKFNWHKTAGLLWESIEKTLHE